MQQYNIFERAKFYLNEYVWKNLKRFGKSVFLHNQILFYKNVTIHLRKSFVVIIAKKIH